MRRKSWYRLLLCGVLFAICFPSSAQDLDSDTGYKAQLAAIESKLQVGDLENALKHIEETLVQYPRGAEVHYAKSLLFAQAGNFQVAVPSAQQAVEIAPENVLYNNHLLELYKSQGEFDSAVDLIDQVIERLPENPQIYREKIMLQHAAKRSEEALVTYSLTRDKFGETDTLDVLKSEILLDLNRKEEATVLLEHWRKEKSPIRQVYSTLSYIHLDQNEPKAAIRVLKEGVENSQDDLLFLDLADANMALKKENEAYENIKTAFESERVSFMDKHRAMMGLLSGNSPFAVPQLQELSNILVLKHPRMPDSHMFKGDVLWMKGELDQAKSLYLTTVSMNAKHVDAWRKLVNVELAQNQLDAAIADGNEALRHNPGNVIITYFVGVAHMMKKDTVNARIYLERALDYSGNENDFVKSMVYGGLGDLYHEIQMDAASDVAYQEAIKLDSSNATVLNNAAYYLSLRKKDLDKAEDYARRANELEPESGTFQDTYAWVLFQQERYDEALKWIEKAVDNSDASAVLFEHYGDILIQLNNKRAAIKQWEKALAIADDSVNVEKIKQKISEKKYIE